MNWKLSACLLGNTADAGGPYSTTSIGHSPVFTAHMPTMTLITAEGGGLNMNGQTFDFYGTWDGDVVDGEVFFRVDEIPSSPTDVATRIYRQLTGGRSLRLRRRDWGVVAGNSLTVWDRNGDRAGRGLNMFQFTVYGNHGTMRVNSITGAVLDLSPDYDEEPDAYADIVQFDTDEFRMAYPGEKLAGQFVDVVDIGFWTTAGAYYAAEPDFRAHVHNGTEPTFRTETGISAGRMGWLPVPDEAAQMEIGHMLNDEAGRRYRRVQTRRKPWGTVHLWRDMSTDWYFEPNSLTIFVGRMGSEMTKAQLKGLIDAINASREDAGPMEVRQLQILLEVAREPGVTAQTLGQVTGIPQQTISRLADGLGSGKPTEPGRGLIEALDDPHERRRKIHFLTREGQAKVADILTALTGTPSDFRAPTAREWINGKR
eukprot:gene19095-19454_t